MAKRNVVGMNCESVTAIISPHAKTALRQLAYAQSRGNMSAWIESAILAAHEALMREKNPEYPKMPPGSLFRGQSRVASDKDPE